MARKRQATRGRQSQPLPMWVGVAAGILIGVVVMVLVQGRDWSLAGKRPEPKPSAGARPAPSVDTDVPESAEAVAAPKKPAFEFYQVLPEKEVIIPDADIRASAKAEQLAKAKPAQATPPAGNTTPATSAATTSRYLLQAGSFSDVKSADEVKAKLALLGFGATVQQVVVNGKTWNRVSLGPYSTASDLEVAKRTLAQNGVNVVAMKETR